MQVEPYVGLAALYDTIGMSAYSETLIPRVLQMAFIGGWVGRTVIDIGCGTGLVACYLGEQAYRTIGLDSSSAMLTIAAARAQADGLTIEWLHGTAQTLELSVNVDMALMLGGTFNMLGSLGDIEQAIQRVANTLDAGKLFIFDMDTVAGLINPAAESTRILYNAPDRGFVVVASAPNYEALTRTIDYTIFSHSESDTTWQTFSERHTQRALPMVAIRRFLTKAGLNLVSILDLEMQPADPENTPRIVVVAQKPERPAESEG